MDVPAGESEPMKFVVTKVSDVGTRHPAVARLMLQTAELLQATGYTAAEQDELKTIYFNQLYPVLLECWHTRDALAAETTACLDSFQQDAKDPRVVHMRSVSQLEQRAEHFLYQAKNYLRNTLRVWNWFYGTKFEDASAYILVGKDAHSRLEEWAIKAFGGEDRRTLVIRSEQEWTVPLVRMRNALEHPGGHSGTVVIENIRIDDDRLIVPMWRRNDERPQPLVATMTQFLEDMLAMGEDILAINIEPRLKPGFAVYEIEEKDRNPEQPARLRVAPTPEFWAKINAGGDARHPPGPKKSEAD
jgi:hypothetical protein